MQAIKSDHPAVSASPIAKYVFIAIILNILIAASWVVFNSYRSKSTLPAMTILSQSALEETYGVRVNLVAVTGAGGFVDVRLKIVDGEKAKLLLTDANNFPALLIGDVILNAPADTKAQEMRFDNGGNMFIMYPNSGNAVQTGTPVTILFGDTALETIPAK